MEKYDLTKVGRVPEGVKGIAWDQDKDFGFTCELLYIFSDDVHSPFLVIIKGKLRCYLNFEQIIEPVKKTIPLSMDEIADLRLDGAMFKTKDGLEYQTPNMDRKSPDMFYFTGNGWDSYFTFVSKMSHYRLPHGEWLPLTKEIEE